MLRKLFKIHIATILILPALLIFNMCKAPTQKIKAETETTENQVTEMAIIRPAEFVDSSGTFVIKKSGESSTALCQGKGWLAFDVNIPVAGRYRSNVFYTKEEGEAVVWLEDYIENMDDRTYDITGKMRLSDKKEDGVLDITKDGSPLNKGQHKMKLHFANGGIKVHEVNFTLMKEHKPSPSILTQSVEGDEWAIAWSDEFDGSGLPDASKWTFDIGDWGWGNNEVQYYTENRTENARMEDGNLIIESRKDDFGKQWTSTRLTTRGKVAFVYGKIELRAKVPSKKGTWAAGWTLGNKYIDEISWPYCGEIDILESVGFETDDETGNGKAHATVHSGAFYFKKGNHFTGDIPVDGISNDFHVYAIEWTPSEIKAFVDGKHYYTYDKTGDELEWPFNDPQNIILNLTMGGGWGGAIDESIKSQQYVIDYVRVYERK